MPTSYFSRIFGGSPIAGIKSHMETVQACAALLVPLFEALVADDRERVASVQEEIAALESEADELKSKLRRSLPETLFMPVSRADLLNLISIQDHIANLAQDIAGVIKGRRMRLPESTKPLFTQFVQRAVDACNQANESVDELSELFESGFRGQEVKIMESMIDKLDEIERDTDDMNRELRHQLFDLEAELPPVDVMFLYKIIDWISDLADESQRVGSRLQLLLAR